MSYFRRFLGTLVLLLAAVGIVVCLAGIVAIWMFHQRVYTKVEDVTTRLDGGLERASTANHKVRQAVEQARTSVGKVRQEAGSAGSKERGRLAAGTARKLIRQQVAPNVKDVGVRLATLSDAATAISSLLQSLQEAQPFQTGRLPSDRVEGWTDQAEHLSATLHRLETVVGDGNKDSSEQEVDAASSAVDLALQRCQARLDRWQSELQDARENVRSVKAEVLGWLTTAVVVVSLLIAWVASGQISLFAHGLKWWH
jgi:hypothetical protein